MRVLHTTLRRGWMVAVLGGVLITTACGSTVDRTAARDEFGGDDGVVAAPDASVVDDMSLPTSGAPGSTPGRTPRAGGSVSGANPGRTTGGAGGPSGSAKIPAGAGVRGVTDKTIKVGMVTFDAGVAGTAAGQAAGSGRGSTSYYAPEGNFQKANEAVVAYVNATGGIAGRKIEAVYHKVTPAQWVTADGRNRDMQSACAAWTEDHRVFAFSAYFVQFEQGLDCAARAQTPMVAVSGHAYPSQRRFDAMADYWYGPHHFLSTRRETALARFLLSQGFFGQGARVAVMIEDTPGVREGVQQALKPALAAAGITPVLEVVYPDFIQSPWPNYVLQMQMADVTHVIFSAQVARGSYPALFMMRAANEQRFNPKWALGTDNARSLIEFNPPREQLPNVVGMGWYPETWFGGVRERSGNFEVCAAIMRGVGEPEMLADSQCEFLFFLRAAMANAREVSPSGLAEGVAALRTGHPGLYTIGGATAFGRRKHDGLSVVQLFRYDRQRDNFRYAGSPQAVPE